MSISDKRNGGAYCASAFAAVVNATAGGAGNNVAADGAWADRSLGGTENLAQSCKVIVAYSAVLAAGKALDLTMSLQDAADNAGTGAAAFGASYGPTPIATSVGGGTVTGTVEFDFDLTMARGFIRPVITPDLTNTVTDTATVSATIVFFGADRQPMSRSLV